MRPPDVLLPALLAGGAVLAAEVSPLLIIRRSSRRRALAQQVMLARAGQVVDLSRALPRAAYRELNDRMRDLAFHETRRLAGDIATYTGAGPARVLSAAIVRGQGTCLTLVFTDGWQLTVSGVSSAGAAQLLKAAREGMVVTGVEIVEGLLFRLRLRWATPVQSGQTCVKLAALRGPSSTERMQG